MVKKASAKTVSRKTIFMDKLSGVLLMSLITNWLCDTTDRYLIIFQIANYIFI